MTEKNNKKPLAEKKLPTEITVGVQASGFPFSLFKEWEVDCKEKYGNCRWLKMWNDHLAAVGSRITDEMLAKIAILEDRFAKLEGKPSKKEPKTLTLGGLKEDGS